jgi:predicted dehydrogenase
MGRGRGGAMSSDKATRVAVIGASGIGKHHAKWWHLEGARVCAFAGTSEDSVASTSETLKELFPFEGRGYTDVDAMIAAESPEIVDVCSPPARHYEHVKTALAAGCHVLCEKPFVYDSTLETEVLIGQARELAGIAEREDRRLGLCTQYTVGAGHFCRLWGALHAGKPITHYHGHLESPAKGRTPDPGRVWIDLAPHVISGAQAISPNGEIDWETVKICFSGYEARAEFDVRLPSGACIRCDVITRNRTEPPSNVRHFKLNGYAFNVEGDKDEEGVYCARIETPGGNYLEPDFMRALIGAFLEGQPIADAAHAVTNTEWLLGILERK